MMTEDAVASILHFIRKEIMNTVNFKAVCLGGKHE